MKTNVMLTPLALRPGGERHFLEENRMSTRLLRQLATALFAAILTAACAQTPPAKEEPNVRLAKADAMFAERCKKAGEFIHRTAENVEGVLLMKLRPGGINYGDQYKLNDPYGRDYDGDAYIKSMLRGFNTPPSEPTAYTPVRLGYRYVEALDEKDGQRYRYTGSMKAVGRKDPNTPNHQISLKHNPNFDLNIYAYVLDKVPAPGPAPRYGVTYDDISTREDRDYWIAGSSLKVIDLKTNEVMAERIGYMMDSGQGNTGGGRSPWLLAADQACPAFIATRGAIGQPGQTELFTAKVLKPNLEK